VNNSRHPGGSRAWRLFSVGLLAVLGVTLAASSAPITVFSTGFEPSEGYDELYTLYGQEGWEAAGNGGNGLISDPYGFPTMGQQAYVGYLGPESVEDGLWLWRPLGFSPVPDETPLVRFNVDMAIYDGTGSDRDEFRWEVYTTNGNRLFTLAFNNSDRKISYWLETSASAVNTGRTFNRDTRYHLQVLLDFLHNRWSATLDTTLLATNQPMTQTGVALDLGDIDAVWIYADPAWPGDNFMLFDNYQVTRDSLSRPTLDSPGLANGRFSLRLRGEPGWRYAIDSCDLLGSMWIPRGTNLADNGGMFRFTNNPAPPPQRFYRARLVP
jgi:hypothetical protein